MIKLQLFISGFFLILFVFFHEQKIDGQHTIHLEKTYQLPDLLSETSGLLYYNGIVWTFNDSGGEPEIYGYSLADSAVISTLTLWNGTNYDWESITQDSSNIYIGDFGNNFGNRNNLSIYVIKNNNLSGKVKGRMVKSSRIHFTYPEYKPDIFQFRRLSSFDGEAMVWKNDSIFIFTKNWETRIASIYVVPAKPGKYNALKIGEFHSGGLITDACYHHGSLYLLGYESTAPFLWIFKDITDFRKVNPKTGTRFNLTMLAGAQTEGIAVVDDHTILISAEKAHYRAARLFLLKMK